MVNTVRSENVALAKFDLTKANDIVEFYTAVFELSKLPTASASIKNLAQQVSIAQEKFTATILDSVTKYIKANPDNVYGEFLDALKEDFAAYENFQIEDLFSREND